MKLRYWAGFSAISAVLMASCAEDIDAGGVAQTAVEDDDPLALTDEVETGSLNDLHARIIQPGCAGQPGLCHFGQFEPNLSTPALTYLNLVAKPGLERRKQYRITPGDPANSLLIDKLRNHDVISQMPLGAAPLAEEDLAAIEAWIAGGALRSPGAEPAPILNNPPLPPEIAVFDDTGARLDSVGPALVSVGQTITLRQTVEDFEVEDASMPLAVFLASLADGRQLLFSPELASGGETAVAAYDANGPESKGDYLNWAFDYVIPAQLDVQDPVSFARSQVAAQGQTLALVAAYIDGDISKGKGYLTYSILANGLVIQ